MEASKLIRSTYWREDTLEGMGFAITPGFVIDVLGSHWASYGDENVREQRLCLPISDSVGRICQHDLSVAVVAGHTGVRRVAKGKSTGDGSPRALHVDLQVCDQITGERLLALESKTISLATAAWHSLLCLRLLLQRQQAIDVFLFGAGALAEWVVKFLNEGGGGRIRRIMILGSGSTGDGLVQKLSKTVRFSLVAVSDKALLPRVNYVITALDGAAQPFRTKETAPNAVILSLGLPRGDACSFRVSYLNAGDWQTIEGIEDAGKVLDTPSLRERLFKCDGRAHMTATSPVGFDIAVALQLKALLQTKVDALRRISPQFEEIVRGV